ncbi:YidH family protein [Novosphingobium sp. YAF33]|jgi:putative membrane protein|uniref:YidH family protein n=1 Tax=Novosphingobium sp. YAF33 TaxID=3233082 RepID=UPI003F9B1BBE
MATKEPVRAAKPDFPKDLGATRTILAADRTLMAWIRTSLSMLSFGFTIYKFLQGLADSDQISRADSPQHVGMFLAAAGTGAMLLGTASYWVTLREVARMEPFRLTRSVLLVAFVMSIAGLFLFIAIANRLV